MRARGFTLLEVLLAIALVGSGVIALLVVRSNSIDNAATTIRLRSQRMLLALHTGHHLAYGLDPAKTPPLLDWQEAFPGFDVQHNVSEVTMDELLPDDLQVVATPAADEAAAPGSQPTPDETAEATPLVFRRLELTVTPPGAEDDGQRVVKVVTYKLVAPAAGEGADAPAGPGPGTPGAGGAKPKFPSYPDPLVGPDAKIPGKGTPPPSGTDPGTAPPDGGQPPPAGG